MLNLPDMEHNREANIEQAMLRFQRGLSRPQQEAQPQSHCIEWSSDYLLYTCSLVDTNN